MKQISRFAIDMEAVAQDPEATHAPILVDGVRTRHKLEGVRLVDQYEANGGYLIFTDCDCPYEELTFVTLLDEPRRRALSRGGGRRVDVAWPQAGREGRLDANMSLLCPGARTPRRWDNFGTLTLGYRRTNKYTELR